MAWIIRWQKKRDFYLVLGLCLLAAGAAATLFGEESIRSRDLGAQVRILAAADMEGRASGTPGGKRAAAHIAEEFRKAGLKPAGDHAGYLQAFEITTGTKLGKDNRLVLEQGAGPRLYQPGSVFLPYGFSDEGGVSSEVVFAGYGITAPELGYDDYAGLDVRGKIVLVMTHEPREKNPHGPFRRPEAFRYTELRTKVINAREHGAKGIFIVQDPNGHVGERERLFPLRGSATASAGLIAVSILREIADDILKPQGQTLAQLQKEIDESLKPRSFSIPGQRARVQVNLVREKNQAANVVGILPGADPRLKGDAIVVGAHYDGLGRGGENSLAPERLGEIHPGADDNASGTAGVIALAQAFSRSRPGRTLVFIAFAAEEMGLLGSTHYVGQPAWPMEKTYAMINLDGIGRLLQERLYLLGVDTASELRPLIQQAAQGFALQLSLSGDGFGPSDHSAFYAKGRPVLMFFTGAHQDYHRPSDTAEKINATGMERVVRFVYRVTAHLASRREALTFVRVKGDAPRSPREERGGYGAYLGSIPDFSESPAPGVRLSGVRPGSPAERIGLKAGDTIVKLAGVTIRNLDDLVYALRSKRPGDKVEVLYLREGKELKGEATLEERR